ncbi:MAG: helix-turn-helix transcriptional regulator [Bacilli bacterium]|jgi:putative transcriptional regulator|nr:helix-turn-helix transcriptional regulator [Bacilli bacterium]
MYEISNLKKLRLMHHLTVYQMASQIRVTPAFYSQIENKKRRLFYDVAIKIAAVFNMRPDELFYTKET